MKAMPLLPGEGSSYVKVVRLHVSSSPGSPYDFRFDLLEPLNDVIGLELTSYSLPRRFPSFRLRGPDHSGTNHVDFFLDDGSTRREFAVALPQRAFSYLEIGAFLTNALAAAIAADPIFGTAGAYNVYWTFTVRTDERLELRLHFAAGPVITWGLLFGSGANAADSAAEPLGFLAQDYSNFLGGPNISAPSTVRLEPYAFVNVEISEVPELNPVARIYLPTGNFLQNEVNASRTRLLSSQPLRKLTSLSIRLVAEGGVLLRPDDSAHEFGFSVLVLGKELALPPYLQQLFVF